MKRAFWTTALAAGMFFAGWFCRPEKGELTVNEMRGRLKMAVAARLSGEDPGKANFSRSGSPPMEIRPLNSLGEVLAAAEMMGRSRYESAVPVMEILSRLTVTDVATVRRLIEEYGGKVFGRRPQVYAKAYAALLFRWAMLQPEEAAQYSFSHPELLEDLSEWNPMLLAFAAKQKPGSREKLLAGVPKEERADMEEFLSWRETAAGDPAVILTDPEKRKHLKDYWAFSAMARQWLLRDPDAMLRWSGTLSGDPRQSEIRGLIMDYFNDLGGDRPAMEAKLSLLPPDFTEEARVKWVSQLPRAEARKELTALVDDGADASAFGVKIMAADALVKQFAVAGKFAEAAQWASGLEPGKIRTQSLENIAETWSRKDSLAASEWVNALPPGPERDAAAGAMIFNILGADPDAALQWANSLSDVKARGGALNTVFRNWFSRRPAQAYQAFQSLSPEDQARVIPAVSPKTSQ